MHAYASTPEPRVELDPGFILLAEVCPWLKPKSFNSLKHMCLA
jgi:hypothetical protein